jgi:uncharacterized protein
MEIKQPLQVKCPVCASLVEWVPSQEYRPFCSARCKMIDLGDWATEAHKIPGSPLEADPEDVD